MMLRKLAVGAAALVVGGFTVSAASPAYAQEGADLEISVVGTTIADGADGKFATTELRNHGPETATGILVTYNVSALDSSKVVFALDVCGDESGGEIVCAVDPIESKHEFTFFDPFKVVSGATGSAGTLTVSVIHDATDPDTGNNAVTVELVIGDAGVDLSVFAPDIGNEAVVDEAASSVEFLDSELMPGSETVAFAVVENQGSVATSGVEVSMTLPEHVTFTRLAPVCTHAVGDSSTSCEFADMMLQPSDMSDFCDSPDSCAVFAFSVKVSEDAPSPASLTGGVAEAWDMQLEFMLFTATDPGIVMPPDKLPEEMLPDIDPSDNVSFFSFFVAGPDDGGEPGDDGDDSGQGGGDGDDEPLPVTGSPVVLISGFGAALLAVGAVLFLVARRRRVVLADPVDS